MQSTVCYLGVSITASRYSESPAMQSIKGTCKQEVKCEKFDDQLNKDKMKPVNDGMGAGIQGSSLILHAKLAIYFP